MELCGRESSGNFAEMTTSTPFRDLLHAANLRHGTDGFTSPPKDFFALKNPDGFGRVWTRELRYLKAARYPRPPKPLGCGFSNHVLLTTAGTPTGVYSHASLSKVKCFPVHAMKAYRGSGGIAPLILNLGTGWRGWLTSSCGRPRDKTPVPIGGWVGPRAGLDSFGE